MVVICELWRGKVTERILGTLHVKRLQIILRNGKVGGNKILVVTEHQLGQDLVGVGMQ